MEKHRKRDTALENISILRPHVADRVVSDLCDELGLQPTVFYSWQKAQFENGTLAFASRSNGRPKPAQERKIAAMEAMLPRKDEVLSELVEEQVALKRGLGQL